MKNKVDISLEKLKELYIDQRLSCREISIFYNCSRDTISYRLKKYGINLRDYKGIDLTGKKFGKLTVISMAEDLKSSVKKWHCICECGRKTRTITGNLVHKGVKSCRHCANTGDAKYYQEIPYEFFYRIKQGAEKRNMEFNLTIEYIWELLLKQERKCALTGVVLHFGKGDRVSTNRTISLDRVDSLKGYIHGNVQWVHKDINRIKQNFSESYFIELCNKVSNYRKNNELQNDYNSNN